MYISFSSLWCYLLCYRKHDSHCFFLNLMGIYSFACWVISYDFLSPFDFFQNYFFKKIFQGFRQSVNHFVSRSGPLFCFAWSVMPSLITFANSFDPDQARQNVWPDLDLNCWHSDSLAGVHILVWRQLMYVVRTKISGACSNEPYDPTSSAALSKLLLIPRKPEQTFSFFSSSFLFI